jgi:hypothetical protein
MLAVVISYLVNYVSCIIKLYIPVNQWYITCCHTIYDFLQKGFGVYQSIFQEELII